MDEGKGVREGGEGGRGESDVKGDTQEPIGAAKLAPLMC